MVAPTNRGQYITRKTAANWIKAICRSSYPSTVSKPDRPNENDWCTVQRWFTVAGNNKDTGEDKKGIEL